MDLSMEMSQELQARVSPGLIAINHILALSSAELQQTITEELEENPALEMLEKPSCPVCGAALSGSVCSHCLAENKGAKAESPADDYFEDYGSQSYAGSSGADPDFDPMTLVAAEAKLSELLLIDLRAALPHDDFAIAEYLVGNLDERGYLTCSVETVADTFFTPLERVERVLAELQQTGPVGVGARDVRECLLLQLDHVELREGKAFPIVRAIISEYFTELGEHKYGYIAQALGISSDEVAEARDFIKTYLSPYPALESGEARTWSSPSRSMFVSPDVLIMERDGELEVEVIESKRFFLRMNPLYHRLAGQVNANSGQFSEEEKLHIQHYVSRARLFMSNINQRRETMNKITNCLIAMQEDFIRNGVRHLLPLTRAMVADQVGLHESTVSRATAGKYVMLPSREVVPFSDFFTASLSIKDVIKEIVTKEARPLTDQEIVSRLRGQGIRLARRTVAKYRQQLGILPSTLR